MALRTAFSLLQIGTEVPADCSRETITALVAAISKQVLVVLDRESRAQAYEYVYLLELPLLSSTPSWGEDNAHGDLERLVAALDTIGALGRPPVVCPVWMAWETHIACKAHIWRMNRKTPSRFVGFVNGLGLSLDGCRWDAYRLSDSLFSGEDMWVVYNAAPAPYTSMAVTPALQDGVCFPASRRLLELWMHFFWTRRGSNETLLQVCHSQGAAHARTALRYLPAEFQPRMRFIALAPAAFFPPDQGGVQVVHVYKVEDPVLMAAHGFSTMPRGHRSLVCVPHYPNEGNPHDPHTSSYINATRPYVERWKRTGNLFD